jgi:hypothetical protein
MKKYREALYTMGSMATTGLDESYQFMSDLLPIQYQLLSDLIDEYEMLKEKEKSKKPIIRVTWKTSYSCPHCGFEECRINDEDEQGYGGNYETPKHCQNCGGALDWSKFHKKMLDYGYHVEARIIHERKYIDRIMNETKTERYKWSGYE